MSRDRLQSDKLRSFSQLSNWRGAADVFGAWGLIGLAVFGAHYFHTWWSYPIAFVIIASRQAALANLAHDAWHRLCFRSKKVNDLVGAWLYSYPVGIPFFHDRQRHFAHHRIVGHDNDPDWVNYSSAGRETPGRVLRYLGGRLVGSLLVSTAWSVLVRRQARIQLEHSEPQGEKQGVEGGARPAHEMLRVASVQLVLMIGLGLTFQWWTYFALWLLPLATLTAFCNNLRAYVEHVTVDDHADPEARLRDIDAGLIERAFVSPAHFHYHALHHEYPSIPHYSLARAKYALADQFEGRYPFPVAPGYFRSLRRHLAQMRTRREHS